MHKNSYFIFFLIVPLQFFQISCGGPSTQNERVAKTTFKGFEDVLGNDIKTTIGGNKEIQNIQIPQKLTDSVLKLKSLVHDARYVPLETTPDCLIGEISKIIATDTHLIVLDKKISQGIFLFDKKGKFLSKIDSRGKGPGEFLVIADMAFNRKANEIILYDDMSNKMNFYSLTGKFIRQTKGFYCSLNLANLNGNFINKLSEDVNYHLKDIKDFQIIGATGDQKIVSKFFRDNMVLPNNNLYDISNFCVSNNKVLYTPIYTDTIYEIKSPTDIAPKYHIDMGSKNFVKNIDRNINIEDFMKQVNTRDDYFFEGLCYDTDNSLYFKLFVQGSEWNFFFSKKTKKLVYGNMTDPTGHSNIGYFTYPIASYNNSFISVLKPIDIASMESAFKASKAKSFYGKSTELESLLNSVNENDNPIIMFYTLNEEF